MLSGGLQASCWGENPIFGISYLKVNMDTNHWLHHEWFTIGMVAHAWQENEQWVHLRYLLLANDLIGNWIPYWSCHICGLKSTFYCNRLWLKDLRNGRVWFWSWRLSVSLWIYMLTVDAGNAGSSWVRAASDANTELKFSSINWLSLEPLSVPGHRSLKLVLNTQV